jgi:hypothetical protein
MTDHQAEMIANAIRRISQGDSAPAGLEGLAMSIAGDHLAIPLSSAVSEIAEAINNLADAVREFRRGE